jgi:hypothetical protein
VRRWIAAEHLNLGSAPSVNGPPVSAVVFLDRNGSPGGIKLNPDFILIVNTRSGVADNIRKVGISPENFTAQ